MRPPRLAVHGLRLAVQPEGGPEHEAVDGLARPNIRQTGLTDAPDSDDSQEPRLIGGQQMVQELMLGVFEAKKVVVGGWWKGCLQRRPSLSSPGAFPTMEN